LKESICIPIGGTWESQAFDAALTSFHADHSKRGVRYQALGPNCFTYVVEFLNSSNFNGHSDHTVESIEENLLGPPSVDAINHLLLSRMINEKGSLPASYADTQGLREEGQMLQQQRPQQSVKVLLYADGFTIDGGELRRTGAGHQINDAFVASLMQGTVPDELIRHAHNGHLELDLDDLRPKRAIV
jgi:hypothetical protein